MSSSPMIVVVNTFCKPNSKVFNGYIDYLDREEAVRCEANPMFNLFAGYTDYVGNVVKAVQDNNDELIDIPEDMSPIFTRTQDCITKEEKQQYKNLFFKSEENGSLMWQTVMSFDNEQLAEHGLYDKETNHFDEAKLRNAVRTAMNKLLEKEGLNSAQYTAAFHYNTDNLHVHFATVELNPTRKKKLYPQWEIIQTKDEKWDYKKVYNEETGKMEKVPILGADGNQLFKEEYIGKFKQKNIELAKSVLNACLTDSSYELKEIDDIARNKILNSFKDISLYDDIYFREHYFAIMKKLPEDGNAWFYNKKAMKGIKTDIDNLIELYIERYHKEDFELLNDKLEAMNIKYEMTYGGKSDWKDNKIKDLYSRMGNTILSSMKDFIKTQNNEYETQFKELIEKNNIDYRNISSWTELEKQVDQILENSGIELKNWQIGFSEEFKKMKYKVLNKENGEYILAEDSRYKKAHKLVTEKEFEKATKILIELSQKNNILAIEDLAFLYSRGLGVEKDLVIAYKLYQESLAGLEEVYNNKTELPQNMKETLILKLAGHYYYGLGTDVDYERAKSYYSKSQSSSAKYMLGTMHEKGLGFAKNDIEAIKLYEESANDKKANPMACIKLGKYYSNTNKMLSENYNQKAYEILANRKNKDDNANYRLGIMLLSGIGTEINIAEGLEFLESSAELNNLAALYRLGKIYTTAKGEHFTDGYRYLKYVSDSESMLSQFSKLQLGHIYMKAGYEKDAKKMYAEAASEGNAFAQMILKKKKPYKYYNSSMEKAFSFLRRSLMEDKEHYLNMSEYNDLEINIESNL